jgi:hypothetical protein
MLRLRASHALHGLGQKMTEFLCLSRESPHLRLCILALKRHQVLQVLGVRKLLRQRKRRFSIFLGTPSTIVFADRPVRAAGHMPTAHLVKGWGKQGEGFVKDPPNATVSVFSKDNATVHDAVVVLKSPKLEGDRLTFTVKTLEGNLAGADGPAAVFIDTADFEVSALQSMFPSTNWPPSMRR